jgi:two-component system nitrogen regulation response regulator GlnG
LDAGTVERLKAHDWPGNVRELENLLRRVAALTPGPLITAREIEGELGAARAALGDEPAAAESFEEMVYRRLAELFSASGRGLPEPGLHARVIAEVERPLIQLALKATRGNQIRAAHLLGINRNTLRKKIQDLGVSTGRGD